MEVNSVICDKVGTSFQCLPTAGLTTGHTIMMTKDTNETTIVIQPFTATAMEYAITECCWEIGQGTNTLDFLGRSILQSFLTTSPHIFNTCISDLTYPYHVLSH